MVLKTELKILAGMLTVFSVLFFLPVGASRFDNAVLESLKLAKSYAREHVLFCLVPAFFIAGAISVFLKQESVMKYLGPNAPKPAAYGVASVSGTVLAVCSCTVLPLFAGIYRMGAGIGPASAFLYSGPAINILAITLTARVLGLEMGIARTVGAIGFALAIGLLMQFVFRKEVDRTVTIKPVAITAAPGRPLGQLVIFLGLQILILVFANWGESADTGLWARIHQVKWWLTGFAGIALAVVLARWFQKEELKSWVESSWDFAKLILPVLFIGILVTGFFLGTPGNEGMIPSQWVAKAVGGSGLFPNLLASILGGFIYFATLTEIPILQGLMESGMGKGPALALLLAGPAVSLPSMLVIRAVLGTRKTVTFVTLVMVMATIAGMIFETVS